MSSTETPQAPTAKFRYHTVAPAAVRLKVEDLTAFLPEGAWIGTEAEKQRMIALPSGEILTKNFPQIRFSRLRELLPGCIRETDADPEWIALPTDRVVLAYRLETTREILPEPAALEKLEASAPPVLEAKATEPDSAAPAPEASPKTEKPVPAWKRLLKPILAPPPADSAAESPKEEIKAPESTPAPVITPEVVAPEPVSSAPVSAPAEPERVPAPVALAPTTFSAEVETRLQNIFMTEDTLTIQRLIDLSGALPGLRGCVLCRGTQSVSSAGVPAGFNVRALGDGATELLKRIGENSSLALTPALTLYSESGPISFLQRGDFSLLVIHTERGFLPGVREKLETVLDLTGKALPAS